MDNLIVRARIGEGGRIVIPAKIRKAIGADIGDSVTMSVRDRSLEIITGREALKRLQALVKGRVPNGASRGSRK